MNQSIEKLRLEYGNTPLLNKELELEPLVLFKRWLAEAVRADVIEPNGMTFSTVTSAGHPSSRTVLLKGVSENGFCFYTNKASRKAEHVRLHPFGSLTFWWREIFRQVNVEGAVQEMPRAHCEAYFYKRPKGAQVAALASYQSAPLACREELDEVYQRLLQKYRGKRIPFPKDWGGYCVVPERIEFWQGRKNRLHDRFLFVKTDGEWLRSRLAP
ncbi:MAG: Pyridoxine/pyridoxamine 5'-phosphate oxidase [Chlamydiales bacterium]|nr:Pyridoxine/pyridoxamine 5'-phosphate oxidase [Chlamydiales bacterium]